MAGASTTGTSLPSHYSAGAVLGRSNTLAHGGRSHSSMGGLTGFGPAPTSTPTRVAGGERRVGVGDQQLRSAVSSVSRCPGDPYLDGRRCGGRKCLAASISMGDDANGDERNRALCQVSDVVAGRQPRRDERRCGWSRGRRRLIAIDLASGVVVLLTAGDGALSLGPPGACLDLAAN